MEKSTFNNCWCVICTYITSYVQTYYYITSLSTSYGVQWLPWYHNIGNCLSPTLRYFSHSRMLYNYKDQQLINYWKYTRKPIIYQHLFSVIYIYIYITRLCYHRNKFWPIKIKCNGFNWMGSYNFAVVSTRV